MTEQQLFGWGICSVGLVYAVGALHFWREFTPRWARVLGIVFLLVWFAPVVARVWWNAAGFAQ